MRRYLHIYLFTILLWLPVSVDAMSINISPIKTDSIEVEPYTINLPPTTISVFAPEPIFALKTNMLLYAILMPNIEGEIYFLPRWSINGEWQVAWWAQPQQMRYWRYAAGGIEFRYWFVHHSNFNGHFVGLYGSMGIYDLANGNSLGYKGDYRLSVGVSYGYMMPIGRRLSLEFSIGVGYLETQYQKYKITDAYNLFLADEKLTYVGITKLKVALVWRLGDRVVKHHLYDKL